MPTRTLVRSVSFLLAFLTTFSLGLLSGSDSAWAVPSFARQTGLACEQCHTSFPELTAFGRRFKLEGYTLTGTSTVGSESENLALNATPPFSAMLQVAYSKTAKALPDATDGTHSAQNGTILLPAEFSLFYAGRISPKIGAFTQLTYSLADDHFSMDNADIRAADTATFDSSRLTYGLTVNNNPTVQDLWNTTPTWGFPFAATELIPETAASTLLDGGLAILVAGVGGYAAYAKGSNMLYGEYTRYQSTQVGSAPPLDSNATADVIQGSAPYLRAAYEYDFGLSSLEVGLVSLKANLVPAGSFVDTTPTDKYSDTAIDAQLQYIAGTETYGVKAIQIKEKADWGAVTAATTSNLSDKLTTSRVTLSYLHKHVFGVNVQSFSTTGDTDAGKYGTRTGSPDTTGNVVELVYTPWLNTRFSLQFTNFSKFNGASSDYDGTGRNASDNNSTYLLAWFMF